MLNTVRQDELLKNKEKVANSNVLVLGCGAVGSVMAPMLQRMGFETFTLVDGDDVEDHNLNRQLFTAAHVGKNKAMAVAAQMRAIDPDVRLDVVPRYLHKDELEKMLSKYTHVVFAADSLFLEGQVYDALRKLENPPVFVSPRMNGWLVELFTFIPGVTEPKGIYFSQKPDKDYSAGATCTGAQVEERKIPAIASTTNVLCGLATQAIVHSIEGRPFRGHVRLDLLSSMQPPTPTPPAEPVSA